MTARSNRTERAAAAVLLVPATVAMCAMSVLGITRIGIVAGARARADAVADLTALAAVTGGRDAATSVAEANGARLVDLRNRGPVRTVVIGSASVTATASATASDSPPG